jgi:hypothetical protein
MQKPVARPAQLANIRPRVALPNVWFALLVSMAVQDRAFAQTALLENIARKDPQLALLAPLANTVLPMALVCALVAPLVRSVALPR